MRRRVINQKGAILVISAFVLMTSFILCALIIDGGFLYRLKALTRNASEQSALAAATFLAGEKLPFSDKIIGNAKAMALKVAHLNGFSEKCDVTIQPEKGVVSVTIEKKMKFIFAKIIDQFEIDVKITSTASFLNGYRGGKDLMPFCIRKTDLKKGESYKFSLFGVPQILPVVNGGKGTGFFRTNIEEGVKQTLKIGDNIQIMQDNPVSVLYSSLLIRTSGHESEKYDYKLNCIMNPLKDISTVSSTPRMILIPIVDNQKNNLEITDFAAVFIEELYQNVQDCGFNGVYMGSTVFNSEGASDSNKIVRLVH